MNTLEITLPEYTEDSIKEFFCSRGIELDNEIFVEQRSREIDWRNSSLEFIFDDMVDRLIIE